MVLSAVFFVGETAKANYTVLHNFSWPNGARPLGYLTAIGSELYGMTGLGGSEGRGVIFRVNTDGTNYEVLHSFGSGTDGAFPRDSLTPSSDGTTLYGMTAQGGASDRGTIFRVNTDGTGYQTLYSFSTLPDGSYPSGSLTVSPDGSTLFGTTIEGGSSANLGSIFRINSDGTGFQILHSFGGLDGMYPLGSLTVSPDGSTLFGMATYGGLFSGGNIFRINTDGSDYEVLHSFTGHPDGANPTDSLTLGPDGSTLFGMTAYGGYDDHGCIFRIKTDGSDYDILHRFAGYPDGYVPFGSLTVSADGSILFGMTSSGGADYVGTIFWINTDGTGYQVLHEFAGSPVDGAYPYGSLTMGTDGLTLYGMTSVGGAYGDGTIFKFVIPEPSTFVLVALALLMPMRLRRK